jgi:response regulator RpfG family c-di-GMP phosphodiesterase
LNAIASWEVDNVSMLVRPCFIVIDREYASSISTRKLVIETAKLNVITAYSSLEAIETLGRFPAVDGVVLDAGLTDMPCADLIRALRVIQPKLVVVAISGPRRDFCDGANHHLDTFEPARLLELLKQLEPEKSAEIEAHNEKLNSEQKN